MMKLSDIEGEVRFLADESNLNISSGTNLPILNGYYKLFCGLRRFGELEVTDESVVTVASQEAYNWPSRHTFIVEPALMLQRVAGNTQRFVPILPAPDNYLWSGLKNVSASFPTHYKRESLGANNFSLFLRPLPSVAGLQLLIIGQVEPALFVQAADRSVFREEKTDRAFARYVAAQLQRKRDNPARADDLLDEMRDMLPESNYMPSPRPSSVTPWWT